MSDYNSDHPCSWESPGRVRQHRNEMRLLGISGSLRSESTNATILRSLALLAPPEVELVIYQELSQIPAFNPDLEASGDLEPVNRLRAALQGSAAVLFSTPEYAHGIPGALKNALDWVVGSGELSGKPVALINASTRAVFAQAALKEVLFAMNALLLAEAEVTVDLPRRDITPDEVVADPGLSIVLLQSLEVVRRTVVEAGS